MKLYTVTDAYIAYLKGIDSKVLNNYGGIRPYVGIIIEIGGHKYLAPLTSYKAKQEKLNNNLPTIFKVHEKGDPSNKLGLIQLNNMIPVLESEIILIDLPAQEEKYKKLLEFQIAYIKSEQDTLKKRAEKLYELVSIKNHAHYSALSCDFNLLEAKYRKFTPANSGV